MSTTFVGIVNIDLYSTCHRLPNPGETITGVSLSRGFGGKASNACAQFAYLGPQTPGAMITAVGNDASGREVIEHYKNIGLTADHVFVNENGSTGTALCFVLDGGESAIIIHPCPLTLEMIGERTKVISESKVVVTNFEAGVQVALEAMRLAKDGGAISIMNCAPIPSDLNTAMFSNCSVVIANKLEMDAIGEVECLFDVGVEVVVVTLGGDGAVVYRKGRVPANIPAPVVSVVDTTGAGDSFVGALAFGISRGVDYVEAATLAVAAASISVQNIGAQQSYAHGNHAELKPLIK